MIPTFLDLKTGKTAKSTFDCSEFWWTEGNGACDCNRAPAFSGSGLATIAAGNCLGCNRFIAIDVEGDLEGHTKEQLLVMMNEKYVEDSVTERRYAALSRTAARARKFMMTCNRGGYVHKPPADLIDELDLLLGTKSPQDDGLERT